MYKKVQLLIQDRISPATYTTRPVTCPLRSACALAPQSEIIYGSPTRRNCQDYSLCVAGFILDHFTGVTLDITPLPGPVGRRLTRPCLPKL
jgi:hypothetical protein